VAFHLNCPAGPAEVRENCGFLRREVTKIETELTRQAGELCQAWEKIHGIT
jgi:hypothetical protein